MLEKDRIIEYYRNFKKELYIYIYRFTGSQENSEDILHDCFINLIKYSQDHEINELSVRAFLYKTAHNISINFLKRSSRFEFSSIEEKGGGNIIGEDNTVDEIFTRDLNEKIYSIINTMDPLSRSIFVMKKELNLSLGEIGINTGFSERTVRRKLQKAVKYIVEELKKTDFI